MTSDPLVLLALAFGVVVILWLLYVIFWLYRFTLYPIRYTLRAAMTGLALLVGAVALPTIQATGKLSVQSTLFTIPDLTIAIDSASHGDLATGFISCVVISIWCLHCLSSNPRTEPAPK